MSAQPWYVIQSKPRQESQVSAYLRSQGLEVFYPTVRVQPVNPRASTLRPQCSCSRVVQADLARIGLCGFTGSERLAGSGAMRSPRPARSAVNANAIERVRRR